MQTQFSVCYEDQSLEPAAQALANRLNLPLNAETKLQLMLTPERLQLQAQTFLPLYVDFTNKVLHKRRQAGKKQGLVRACRPADGLKILDVTAGWGRDAAILAAFGAEVTMVERNPIMAALLEDALCRRSERAQMQHKLSLVHADAKDYLNELQASQWPDVIYMDPMHPGRQKSALVKKELQTLQQFIGRDADALQLLKAARAHVRQRVVVKWPQRQPPLCPADFEIDGKTVRFDCYLPE